MATKSSLTEALHSTFELATLAYFPRVFLNEINITFIETFYVYSVCYVMENVWYL